MIGRPRDRAPRGGARARTRLPVVAAGLAIVAVSCAPPPPLPLPTRDTVMERYLVARRARERRAAGFAAEALVWAHAGGRALPGAEARLLLAAPDAARLTVGSAFGVACDLAARGDTLEGWVPSRRLALQLDARELGVAPGVAAVRTLGALWQPPGAAWDAATASDSGWRVRWSERADSLQLVVAGDGSPRALEWRPAGGDTIRVRYTSWIAVDGTPWPDRTEWSEADGALSLKVRLTHPRAATIPNRARLRVALPAGAERARVTDLSRWWRRLTGDTP